MSSTRRCFAPGISRHPPTPSTRGVEGVVHRGTRRIPLARARARSARRADRNSDDRRNRRGHADPRRARGNAFGTPGTAAPRPSDVSRTRASAPRACAPPTPPLFSLRTWYCGSSSDALHLPAGGVGVVGDLLLDLALGGAAVALPGDVVAFLNSAMSRDVPGGPGDQSARRADRWPGGPGRATSGRGQHPCASGTRTRSRPAPRARPAAAQPVRRRRRPARRDWPP